ncbi:MAG: DUF370 domain-containing protein [Phascolarctobacterium sp.]|nr:DUF370 domain-containing protein [Phascolarctobacterium sp.]MBR5486362.1 DUF370 domain-containing protein [Phascolarctobacterium sp.]MBR5797043.1 DUF370 domain-containing protein [Phascolarctobacterium sp.]MBR5858030.1 DUF370 domain-containing protein [Phascolarctobacterium sp.]MBR6511467.1 DUF370 domain-containing protein [Phascolarctobacterium sp.]
MVKNSEIIAIFNLRDPQSEIYEDYVEKYRDRYKIVDLSEGEGCSSCILTEDTIYLSAISALTLKKRVEEDFLADSVYSNF